MQIRNLKYHFREIRWKIFGYESFLKRRYQKKHGHPLDLRAPQALTEKLQWILAFGALERFAGYVDKFAVKEFVKERAGPEYVIPTIGVYERVADIDWESLPNSFVIKATHGCHWNVLVKDKRRVNRSAVEKRIKAWLNSNYYQKNGEANYRRLQGRIIIEEYIQDPSGDLKDYKFLCFHGEPVYVLVDSGRFSNHHRDVYDADWNRVPVIFQFPGSPEGAPRPAELGAMLDLCRRLTRDFAFVRVDMYCTQGRIFFGELTFTPGAGMSRISPREFDCTMGQLLDLRKYKA